LSATIGLVGVGPWGKHVLRDLRALGANVHAVARSRESIQRARDGGVVSIVSSPEELPDCDGYIVANRTTSHLDAIETLLPRGKPIFSEKPISSDVARVKRLPPLAHDLVFIMHKWRYHPGIIEMARIAASGELGPVQGLRTLRLGWGNPHTDTTTLWALAPHEMSIALTIFGALPELVSAAPDPTDLDGGAIVHMRAAGGAPFVTEFSFGHPTRLRRIMLSFSDAVCLLDDSDYGAIFMHRRGSGGAERAPVSDDMPLLAELRRFLEHLEGGPAPLSSLADEIDIIEALARIEAMISPR